MKKLNRWRLLMIGALLVFSGTLQAGVYLDLGAGYMRGIEVTRSTSITFDDYTIAAEAKLEAPEDTGYFLFRAGYKYQGWHFEYETRGVLEYHIDSVQIYHRWEF